MKLIASITDENIIGTKGLSLSKSRYASRAIVRNSIDLYAIMHVSKYNFYSLPGGGIEEGEDKITALKRELLEETGSHCYTIKEVGCIYENRSHCDFSQYSYYYFVTTDDFTHENHLTQDEIDDGTLVLWEPWDKVKELIILPQHTTNQRKFVQMRDTIALNEYQRKYGILKE